MEEEIVVRSSISAYKYMLWLRDNDMGPYALDKPGGRASNSDIRRWLNDGAIEINGVRPKEEDMVELPVRSLVYFPGGKRKTTKL